MRETKVADLTPVRLFPAVDSLVFGEGGGVSKGLTTVVASVRPLARVSTKVSRHGGALREPLLTDGTAEWLFSTVCAHMGSQVGGLRERLSTHVTAVRLFTRVRSHVRLQRRRTCIALPADLANVVSRFVGTFPVWL